MKLMFFRMLGNNASKNRPPYEFGQREQAGHSEARLAEQPHGDPVAALGAAEVSELLTALLALRTASAAPQMCHSLAAPWSVQGGHQLAAPWSAQMCHL